MARQFGWQKVKDMFPNKKARAMPMFQNTRNHAAQPQYDKDMVIIISIV